MDISFTCTKCNQELLIEQAGAGIEVNCPKCGVALLVPSSSSVPSGQLKDTIRLSPFPALPPAATRPSRPAAPAQPPAAAGGALYSLPRSGSAPSTPSTPPGTQRYTAPSHQETVRAVITNFDMPMSEMMKHALKWMVAALPAFVILFLLAALIFKLLGVIVRP